MIRKKNIIIPTKTMVGIVSVIAISAVLLSKGKSPEVLLLLIGVFCGVIIGKGFFER